eukprot:scaffold3191_cov1014-Pavlova_lutheri.AAC.1
MDAHPSSAFPTSSVVTGSVAPVNARRYAGVGSIKWEGLMNFSTPNRGEPRLGANPDISPAHPIGRSDGRCVQTAGT